MTAGCAGCGQCCRIIGIGQSMEKIRADLAESLPDRDTLTSSQQRGLEDALFISKYWVPLSEDRAIRADPTRRHTRTKYWYTCTRFDPVTNRCLAYTDRPPVCRNYPWYGHQPHPYAIPYKDCSYWRDVPHEQWPEGVNPLPVPVNVC